MFHFYDCSIITNKSILRSQMRHTYFSPESHTNESKLRQSREKRGRKRKTTSSSKLHETNSPVMPGAVYKVGAYIFDKNDQIGNGYSSHVYKGKCLKDSKKCAIKIIDLKNYTQSSKIMLSNQIAILKKINHPNVVKYYDSYRTATNCYIIMQLCEDGNLQQYLAKRGTLKQSVAVSIMEDILKGVKYLFSLGVIHRDLKPANILNDSQQWKIADFGFAVIAEEGSIKSKQNVGTPLYMPLQSLLYNKYSFQSDIFSIGIIFYELLVGITPWESKTQKELVNKMKSLPYELSYKLTISDYFRTIIQKMCNISTDKRMNRNQFMELSLIQERPNPQFTSEKKKALKKSYTIIPAEDSEVLIKEPHYLNPRTQAFNNHRLIIQLNLCRFLFYFVKNIHYVTINPRNALKLKYIIYVHLVRITANLTNEEYNWFHLYEWDQYKTSQKYQNNIKSFLKYHVKYQAQKLKFQKELDASTKQKFIRTIKQEEYPGYITSNFYESIISNLSIFIREANHTLSIKLDSISEEMTVVNKAQIQGLKSLLKYHNICKTMKSGIEGYDSMEKNIEIKVQIDYSNSHNSMQEFISLRQQLLLL